MFAKLLQKINTFADHHQILFAIIIGFCFISISWAVERIFDEYIFPDKPLHGYVGTIAIALAILWLTKHVILHVM